MDAATGCALFITGSDARNELTKSDLGSKLKKCRIDCGIVELEAFKIVRDVAADEPDARAAPIGVPPGEFLARGAPPLVGGPRRDVGLFAAVFFWWDDTQPSFVHRLGDAEQVARSTCSVL